MSKGDSSSKPANDGYRDGWDYIWGNLDAVALAAAASTRLKFGPDYFEFLPKNENQRANQSDGPPA